MGQAIRLLLIRSTPTTNAKTVGDMTLTHSQGSLKRFRRTPWRFQKTFRTPIPRLPQFVTTIVSSHDLLQAAVLTIDDVVFEPKHLMSLLSRLFPAPELGRDWCINATGPQEISELLQAALSDWVDFAFVPTPKAFVIYADHDEYTTFYANTKSNLNGIVDALSRAGFKSVPSYERDL